MPIWATRDLPPFLIFQLEEMMHVLRLSDPCPSSGF